MFTSGLPFLAPQTQAYGRGSRWAGPFLLRLNQRPPTPALALACPREGPRLFPPACLSHSQLLTICCPLSSPWGGGSGFKDLEPGVKAKPNHGPQRAPDATAQKERLGLGAAALCARRGCLALRGGQGLRPQGWGVRRWEELPGSGSKL